MREAVIVSTARTPIGKAYRGAFNDTDPAVLSGHAVCEDRKSTRLNSSHLGISYAVFCLKKKITNDDKRSYSFGQRSKKWNDQWLIALGYAAAQRTHERHRRRKRLDTHAVGTEHTSGCG